LLQAVKAQDHKLTNLDKLLYATLAPTLRVRYVPASSSKEKWLREWLANISSMKTVGTNTCNII